MEILKIKNDNLDEIIKKVSTFLKSGGVVVHPTDTCYGIAADINNEKTIKKVYDIKKRNYAKPVNIIVKNIEDFKYFGKWSIIIEDILKEERMHGFIVQKTKKVPKFLNSKFNNIGIQIPRYSFSQKMLISADMPLLATSANISGEKIVYNIKDFIRQIKCNNILPDLIIDAGELPRNKPSRLLEIVNDNEYNILRN